MNTGGYQQLRNSQAAGTWTIRLPAPNVGRARAPGTAPSAPDMSTILLLVISIVAPWTVHLAPPRQRALALVGVIAVFLLSGIFAENPLTQWEMWAGLAAGILTVMFLAGGANAGRGGRPRSGGTRPPSRRSRAPRFEEGNEPTGEL
jgi:hypothetical protein